MDLYRIAAVQMDVRLADTSANLKAMTERLEVAAANGARLTIFPECSLTGYCFDSREEAMPFAEPIPGPSCQNMAEACARLNVYAVFGMLEASGDKLFNACVLIGPNGVVGSYRKIHLPFLGIDRFTDPGDRPFEVYSARDLRVGMNICYDSAFPESARVMALDGADLIALPTNFPPGAECMAAHVVNTRAMENNIYYACVNRIGSERGFPFIGQSKICDPSGRPLAEALHSEEATLFADIDIQRARTKRIVRVPEKHIIDRFNDRRPEMYGRINKR
ncbi:MAG: carbon-nitrogen hydrolase family protein [Planctomycetaceae bacterium]|nr:carbon-nitrogen hydrolase family protein [Planctomycetales bacterium]MCB9926719.1 carbon-nitrogen hydrolase family protein [Planctomycetaceae bacterium]